MGSAKRDERFEKRIWGKKRQIIEKENFQSMKKLCIRISSDISTDSKKKSISKKLN